MRTLLSSRMGLAAAVVAISVGFTGAASAEKIRLGLQKFLSYATTYIALDKGYFKDAGLDIETTMIRGGGTAAFNQVLAGQLDIANGSITASMINAIIKGAKFKVIADKGQIRKGHSTNELWVNKAMYDKGLKDLPALRGKKVATSGIGGADWVILGLMAEKYGLSLTNKDILAAGLPAPQRPKALESGTVAGAVLVEPFISKVDRSKAVKLMELTDIVPVFQTAVFYANEEFLNANASAVEKFLGALRKATAEYNKNPKADDLVRIISKYTGVSPEVVKNATPVYFSPDAKVDVAAVNRIKAFFLKSKLIPKDIPIEMLVDKRAM